MLNHTCPSRRGDDSFLCPLESQETLAVPPHLQLGLGDVRGSPDSQLLSEGLAENEVNKRVQASVENRQQHRPLLQEVEKPRPLAPALEQGVGHTHQVVGNETHAEHAHQNTHVAPGPAQLAAGGPSGPLRLLQPPAGSTVQQHQGDQDKQEDGRQGGVDDLVEEVHLRAVRGVAAQGHAGLRLVLTGDEMQSHVDAHHGHQDRPGCYGDEVG